jgi:hypothetical protein
MKGPMRVVHEASGPDIVWFLFCVLRTRERRRRTNGYELRQEQGREPETDEQRERCEAPAPS